MNRHTYSAGKKVFQQSPASGSTQARPAQEAWFGEVPAALQETIGNQTVHSMGNRVVLQLLAEGGIQPKLKIGEPNDDYEQEADRVADQVMRMPETSIDHPAMSTTGYAIQRQEPSATTPSGGGAAAPPLAAQLPEPDILKLRSPFLDRGAYNLWDPNAALFVWRYNFDFFKRIGLGDELAGKASNLTAPFAIDSQLKASNPTWWEITDTELQTTTLKLSLPIFSFGADFRGWQPLPFLQRKEPALPREAAEPLRLTESTATEDPLSGLHEGRLMDSTLRSYFEPRFGADFGDVRLHTGQSAAASAEAVHAKAFTYGRNIVFSEGAYDPHSQTGRSLLAHELTHVVQQTGSRTKTMTNPALTGSTISAGGGATLQRVLTEAQLASTEAAMIHQDPDYVDNRMTRIEFYAAQLAVIHYEDGSELRLGLVPGEIQAPVVGVDYRTPRSIHATVDSPAGQTRFVPRAREIRAPGMTYGQVLQQFGRTITYAIDPTSRRIVPTEVNDITAPRLCATLRGAEAEYSRSMDEMSRGMVKALKILEISLILASFLPTGGQSAAATTARGAATAGAAEVGVLGRAITALRQFFLRLLRSGATDAITVEGVGFGGVRVLLEGRVLTVFRNTIVNVERVAGQGRLVHSAFEQAAIAAAREAGATSARVALQTVVNTQWAAYLESLGYAYEVLSTGGVGFTRVLVKTFTL